MRKGKNLGSNNSNAKFSEKNILKIRNLHKEGINQTQIAKMFCTTQNRISEIVNRKTWRNI
jgi:transcriptional regulator